MDKGLLLVFTGEGKGKTTAAVGSAIRALGQNMKVCYISFHKNPREQASGEIGILKRLGVDTFGFAEEHPSFNPKVSVSTVRQECLKALAFIEKIFEEDAYDLLVLDELCIALRDSFLKEEEVLSLLKRKPAHLSIIITGREAPESICEMADMVSEVRKIKHHFDKGIKAKRGIEY